MPSLGGFISVQHTRKVTTMQYLYLKFENWQEYKREIKLKYPYFFMINYITNSFFWQGLIHFFLNIKSQTNKKEGI